MPSMCGALKGRGWNLRPHEAISVPDRFPLRSAIENDEVQILLPQR